MAIDYVALAARAQELIARYGSPAVHESVVQGAYDPVTRRTAETVTLQEAQVVFASHGEARQPDGAVAHHTRNFLASAADLPVRPKTGDRWIFDGQTFAVQTVETLAPSGEAVVYRIETSA